MSNILIIDDDSDFSGFLREELEAHGHRVTYADSGSPGLDALETSDFGAILLDNRMPGMSGLEVLEEIRRRGIHIPVVMMTGQGTSDVEIEAWIRGVFDFVEKPLDVNDIEKLVEDLEPTIRRAEEFKNRPRIPMPGDETMEQAAPAGERRLLGKSPAIKAVLKSIAQVAPSNRKVLVSGESGTGKELVARAIHDHSPRRDRPFIALNIAALAEGLLESQLFGHEANIATGVGRMRKGYFEDADGGTLFLDEIGEMPIDLQAKLLRVVDNERVSRLGSTDPIPVDVRLVAATNRDLKAEVEQGSFREDLYFRLSEFPIELPPLRERESDLALLGRHFRIRAALDANRPVPQLDPTAVDLLRAYSWPGNVRELQNVLTRAVLKCRGDVILPDHLGLMTGRDEGPAESTDFARTVERAWDSSQHKLHELMHDRLDRELIRCALEKCGGNKTQVAKRLGLAINTVRKLAQKFGLE